MLTTLIEYNPHLDESEEFFMDELSIEELPSTGETFTYLNYIWNVYDVNKEKRIIRMYRTN